MKVKDLIHILQHLKPDAEIVMQRNADDMDYTRVFHVDPDIILLDSGRVVSTEWTHVQAGMSADEWQDILKKPRAAIIYSLN